MPSRRPASKRPRAFDVQRRKPLLRALIAGLAFSCSLALHKVAHADVWGYVDDKGVAHFAAEKLDERYDLFYRSGQSFDTDNGVPERIYTPRAIALPTVTSKLLTYFDISPAYKSVKHLLREASAAHGVDYELLQALIATESGFDAEAVSPRGAIGLMQVLPTTAQRYGVTGDKKTPIEKKLTDPRTNIRAGARYLHDLIALFPGQLDLALAAYNAGEGAVQRAGNKVPNYRETQNYVTTVLQLYAVLKLPPALADLRKPGRVRMELPGAKAGTPAGGAVGRGNMPPSLVALPPALPGPSAMADLPATPPRP